MASPLKVAIVADASSLLAQVAASKAKLSELNSTLREAAQADLEFAGSNAAASQALQKAAEDVARQQTRLAALREELKATRDTSSGLGGAVQSMSDKLNAALRFTGIGIGIEGLRKLGEAIVTLGDRAIQIRTMSEVLGVSVAQFQAMSVAAEESGTSVDVFAHAGERLTTILTEARAGAAKAIEELHELGITTGDIANKNFQLNDVLAVLKTRLNDASSEEQTRKALLQELGTRTAAAVAAIREYDGSEEGAASAMARVNGLMPEQIERLKEMRVWWGELGTRIENVASKALAFAGDALDRYKNAVLAMHAADSAAAGPAVRGLIDRSGGASQAAAEQAAVAQSGRQQEATHNEVLLNEMQSIREGVAAFGAGTAERLAALKKYAADAKEYYGAGNVDEVRRANSEVLAAERELNDKQAAAAKEARATLSRETFDAARTDAEALTANTSLSLAQRLDAERQIWSAVLAGDKLNEAQRLEAAREFSREYTANAKEMAAQVSAVSRQDADTDIAISRLTLQAQKSSLDLGVAATKEAIAQKYAALRNLANQEYALDLQALANTQSTLQQDSAAYEAQADKMRELAAKLTADLAKFAQQQTLDAKHAAEQQATEWQRAVGEIENAEAGMVGDLLGKRKSLSQSLLSISAQLVTSEIANDLKALTTKIALKKEGDAAEKALEQGGFLYHEAIELMKTRQTTTQQAAQTAAVAAGATAQKAAAASAAAAGRAAQGALGASTVMSDAAQAFSGAYASAAAIPIIGWEIAPGVAATAFSTVAAMAGEASLDTGTNYVPTAGSYFLHKGEAVVPEPYNPAAGGEGAGSGYMEQHNYGDVHMSALDTRGLSSLLKGPGNRQAVVQAARTYFSRGGGRR